MLNTANFFLKIYLERKIKKPIYKEKIRNNNLLSVKEPYEKCKEYEAYHKMQILWKI
ncbi:hypothetical protein BG20_I0789 [Candidatus Nitrosarchaeum limnium BG20]|jgi:hypothetical protein|uniref:Uncharacterized protein n=1 Tax=Candidatus Nitrosarchaeum limnium BG20 TaxID=859192 RepID=S2E3H9_9ARCH|nr:hypothetical protein BG20_I0789 [Candidatus Nitrosarchaeum limnium BG20]